MLDKTILCKGELGFPEENKADSGHIWIFSHSHITLHFLVRAGISPREAFLVVFLAGTGRTTNLMRRSFLPRFMSWRLMKHRKFGKVTDCRCFPSSQPFGGSSSTHNDIGTHFAPFPPTWTLDVTTVWKAPYLKKLKREKRSPAVSEQAGLRGLPDCFRVIKQPSQNCCSSW